MNPDIPIVAIGYNRPAALERLLISLNQADYDGPVKLYISLDGGGGDEIKKLSEDFTWAHGEKEIILHGKNLGLRQHVLHCGDLSQRHDALIALEDDLVVSPRFYHFAFQSFQYYQQEPAIGGISLYHHAYNETAQFPFIPLADGSDVYFLKYASSWGQLWGREHWKNFRNWYDALAVGDKSFEKRLPPNIRMWPENSWKKFFISYLIEKDLFFVFPRVSLTTIFSDEGTNIRIRETFLQVPLYYGDRPFHFRPFKDSNAVYDTFCEILPDRLKRMVPDLKDIDLEVDLYGMKPSDMITASSLISSRKCSSPERLLGREMRPHEENLVHHIPGEYYHLGRTEDFEDPPYLARLLKCHEKKELSYWYPIREYHFYKQRLLSTDKKSFSASDPGFLMKKFRVMASYTYRYFRGK